MSDFDEYDVEFDRLKDVKRSDAARIASLRKIKARDKSKKLSVIPLIISSIIVAVVALFIVLTLNEHTLDVTKEKSIIDNQTVAEIPIVEVTPSLFTVEYGVDNMDRGNHDYETIGTDKRIVIDPEALDFKRGDVVYFKAPVYSNGSLAEYQISRVVGLPGEKIEIKKGQVFINDQKLEAFYSNPTVRGMLMQEYLEVVNPQNSMMTEEDFQEDMESISVSEGSVFVLGDQWWRSIDSRHFGPISLSDVEGKVLGYEGLK
ncbi:signal peptidase I [Sporosarcina sp. FSL K6-3457]|uniref:signal peptidase I n=1 Tax=Sporosarcina sp. FSL K6-3457 TaxID=2978204 RepID=UPI0030F72537